MPSKRRSAHGFVEIVDVRHDGRYLHDSETGEWIVDKFPPEVRVTLVLEGAFARLPRLLPNQRVRLVVLED